MPPLVSIMTPCYNSAATLPFALASCLAQDYENWECVVIDDGSTDDPRAVVERANDPRIRYFPFERNRGRGAARQEALDRARGDYLCMLDADDWMYPRRISRQVEVMESEPKLALVSAGMAVVDERNEIVGVRCVGPCAPEPVILGPFKRLAPPPVAHAPSLIRMETARRMAYDPSFPVCEDVDFLLRVLLDRYYCVLPEVNYVYAELGSVMPEKILRAGWYGRRMFLKHRNRFPVSSRANVCKAFAKSLIYRIVFEARLGRWAVGTRSRRPTPEEVIEFREARDVVLVEADQVFGRPR